LRDPDRTCGLVVMGDDIFLIISSFRSSLRGGRRSAAQATDEAIPEFEDIIVFE
jgi:hypothetical protein